MNLERTTIVPNIWLVAIIVVIFIYWLLQKLEDSIIVKIFDEESSNGDMHDFYVSEWLKKSLALTLISKIVFSLSFFLVLGES